MLQVLGVRHLHEVRASGGTAAAAPRSVPAAASAAAAAGPAGTPAAAPAHHSSLLAACHVCKALAENHPQMPWMDGNQDLQGRALRHAAFALEQCNQESNTVVVWLTLSVTFGCALSSLVQATCDRSLLELWGLPSCRCPTPCRRQSSCPRSLHSLACPCPCRRRASCPCRSCPAHQFNIHMSRRCSDRRRP